jgi:hypothetical protein
LYASWQPKAQTNQHLPIDSAYKLVYTVGMNSMQYTIRSIPPKLDATLRKQALQSGKSLNEVVLESLAKGAGVDSGTQTFTDLGWFVGSLKTDQEFDKAIAWLDSLPTDTPESIQ